MRRGELYRVAKPHARDPKRFRVKGRIGRHPRGVVEIPHGRTLYSEVLNIPLVVKLPSSLGLKGERRRQLTQHIDVLPTILDYLGIEQPKHLEGVSLLPAIFLNQQNHRDRTIFSYAIDGFEAGASVIDFPWKFIWNSVSGSNEQLFNMETDPRGKTDLSSEYPLRAKYLKAMIDD